MELDEHVVTLGHQLASAPVVHEQSLLGGGQSLRLEGLHHPLRQRRESGAAAGSPLRLH